MSDLNRMCIMGRMGQDPEKRFLPDGKPVVSFSVATSDKWKDSGGNSQEKTEWHNCVAYGKVADIIFDMGFKGQRVYVEGKKVTDSWDKDGVKQYKTLIKLDAFNGRYDALTFKDSAKANPAPAQRQASPSEPILDSDGEPLPF